MATGGTAIGSQFSLINPARLLYCGDIDFAGASTLSATQATLIVRAAASAAAFAGTSTLFGDATVVTAAAVWQAVANFTGASILAADTFLPVVLHLRAREQKGEVNVSDPWLRSHLDESARPANYIFASFSGASNLLGDPSVVVGGGAQTWQATAQFAGASAAAIAKVTFVTSAVANFAGISAAAITNAVKFMLSLASFAGASTLSLTSPARVLPATGNFAGASTASITNVVDFAVASAKFAGASTKLADGYVLGATTAWPATSAFAGSSSMSANISSQAMSAFAPMPGASSVTAFPYLRALANVSMPGVGVFNATQVARIVPSNVTWAGTSNKYANPGILAAAFSSMAGSGLFSGSANVQASASAIMPGAGALAAAVDRWLPAVTNFAGISTLSTSASQFLAAFSTWPGASSLSATAIATTQAIASFAGTSTHLATPTVLGAVYQWQASAAFAGDSTFSASMRMRGLVSAQLAGSSAMLATNWQRMILPAGTAKFPGASIFYAVTINTWQATAKFAGASAFLASLDRWLPVVAKFAGASTFKADGGRLYLAIATFAGSSSLAAVANVFGFATALFAGSSSAFLDAAKYLAAVASFAGASDMFAKGTPAGTEEGEAQFNGSSGFRATAIIIRNPRVKVLAGSVRVRTALGGVVHYEESLHGEIGNKQLLRAG